MSATMHRVSTRLESQTPRALADWVSHDVAELKIADKRAFYMSYASYASYTLYASYTSYTSYTPYTSYMPYTSYTSYTSYASYVLRVPGVLRVLHALRVLQPLYVLHVLTVFLHGPHVLQGLLFCQLGRCLVAPKPSSRAELERTPLGLERRVCSERIRSNSNSNLNSYGPPWNSR